MNHLKASPTGVDRPIDKLQRRLYTALSALLLEGETLNGYGRTYKNAVKNQFVLEAYNGSGEYEDVVGQDVSNFFFHVDDSIDLSDAPNATVNVIFFLNLNDFYSDQNKRMDEEIRDTIYSVLIQRPFTLARMVSGVDFVDALLKGFLSGFSDSKRDMHPYHVFTVQGSVTYNYKNCT